LSALLETATSGETQALPHVKQALKTALKHPM